MYERVVFIFFPVERPLDIFKKSALEFYEEYVALCKLSEKEKLPRIF